MDALSLPPGTFGRIVPKNQPSEDALLAFKPRDEMLVAAVADGVGGSHRGDIASEAAIEEVRLALSADPLMAFPELFERVAARISAEDEKVPGIATTLTVVRLSTNVIGVGHVGDCRAYHLRGLGIVTLTEDQNEAEFLVRRGVLDRRSVRNYPRRNVLMSALGANNRYELYEAERQALPGDRVLLMSDGAYDLFNKRELAELNSTCPAVSEFFQSVADRVQTRSPRDDASILCLEVAAGHGLSSH